MILFQIGSIKPHLVSSSRLTKSKFLTCKRKVEILIILENLDRSDLKQSQRVTLFPL